MSFGSKSAAPVDVQAEEFKGLRGSAANLIGAFFGFPGAGSAAAAGSPFAGLRFDPSAYATPISNEENSLVKNIYNRALSGAPGVAAADNLRRDIIGGAFLEPDSRTLQTIYRPAIQAYEDTVKNVSGAFTRAGHRTQESSPFAQARARADEGLSNALFDATTSIREAERGRQFQTALAEPQLEGQNISNYIQNLQAVALPRLVAQQGIDKGLADFNQKLQFLLAAIQPAIGTTESGFEASLFG